MHTTVKAKDIDQFVITVSYAMYVWSVDWLTTAMVFSLLYQYDELMNVYQAQTAHGI